MVLILTWFPRFRSFKWKWLWRTSETSALAVKTRKISPFEKCSDKCPCHKVDQSCTRLCRCYNCKNTPTCGVGRKSQRSRRPTCNSQVVSRRSPQVKVSMCSWWHRMHRCLQMFQLWKHCSSSSWPGKNPKTKRSEIGRPSLHTRGRRGRNSRCGGGLWTLKKHWNVLFDGLLSQGISINSKNLHDLYDFVAKSLAVVGVALT